MLADLRRAAGASPHAAGCAVSHGLGLHLGLLVRWRLASCGLSFREDVSSFGEPESMISAEWGHSSPSRETWEVDASGAGSLLEGDDEEVMLLSGWVRTGAWLRPDAPIAFEDAAAPPPGDAAAGCVACAASDVAVLWPADSCRPAVVLRIRLTGGSLDATLHACPDTGVARLLALRVGGDDEAWAFSRDGSLCVHTTGSGARNLYRTDGRGAPPVCEPLFRPPIGSLTSLAGGSFVSGEPSRVPIERSGSGHTLISMHVNGVSGLAILDTGASGLIVSRRAGDAAKCSAFGSVHVSGAGDRVAARWRRADSVRVGPLVLHRPLLLEMETLGLVWGASGPVIGIVGFDLFRRAIVDMPPSPAAHVFIYPPDHTFDLQPPLPWLTCVMGANVPHLWCTWHGCATPELLMVDSGAGGADAILHRRTCERLNMSAVGTFTGTTSLRGVTASSDSRRVGVAAAAPAPPPVATSRRRIDFLELLPGRTAAPGAQGAVRLEPVDTLLLATEGLFDLAPSMSGVVCNPLLGRCRVVVDLMRRRIAVVREAAQAG